MRRSLTLLPPLDTTPASTEEPKPLCGAGFSFPKDSQGFDFIFGYIKNTL